MNDPRTRVVAEGYDAISDDFSARRDRIVGDPRERRREVQFHWVLARR